MMALTIASRELRTLFLSPLAWSILGVLQLILGFMFTSQLQLFLDIQPRLAGLEGAPGVTDVIVTPLYGNIGIILLLVVPLLTMRLIAEERRNRTLTLLFSAPVSMADIAVGKFLGVLGFFLIMALLFQLMPLSLLLGGALDWGKLAASLLGLVLLLAAFASAGVFMSAVAGQPTVAAISTFGLLLLLWIIDWLGASQGGVNNVFSYLSLLRHYNNLLRGLISTTDLLYFVLFITTFLVLTIRRLDNDRLQQ